MAANFAQLLLTRLRARQAELHVPPAPTPARARTPREEALAKRLRSLLDLDLLARAPDPRVRLVVRAGVLAAPVPLPAEMFRRVPAVLRLAEDGAAAAEIHLRLERARVDRWYHGSPVIVVPFEVHGAGATTRRDELAYWLAVDRGGLCGALLAAPARFFTGRSAPQWVLRTWKALHRELPAMAIDFDGGAMRIVPAAEAIKIRLPADPTGNRTLMHAIHRGKFRRSAESNGWDWRERTITDQNAWLSTLSVAFHASSLDAQTAGDGELWALRADLAHHEHLLDLMGRMSRQSLTSRPYIEHLCTSLLTLRDQIAALDPTSPNTFRAPLAGRPEAIARGIEAWETNGRISIRLAQRPRHWLSTQLWQASFLQSKKDPTIWSQRAWIEPAYWTRWIADRAAWEDHRAPELASVRFVPGTRAAAPERRAGELF